MAARTVTKSKQTDVALIVVSALASLALGADAVFTAHSRPSQVLLGLAVVVLLVALAWSGVRAIGKTARDEETDAQTRNEIEYLSKPERVRTIEALAALQNESTAADALFTTNFKLSGESFDTTIVCQVCAFQTSGPLADVWAEGLAHLSEAHELHI